MIKVIAFRFYRSNAIIGNWQASFIGSHLKNTYISIGTLFLALLQVGHAADLAAQTTARTGNISGKIVSTKGGEQAKLIPKQSWQKAVVRQQLKAGDILRTNRSGTLAVVFADRTQVRLGRNSTLVVREVRRGSPSRVSLRKGRVWGRSPRGRSRLSVETPSATAAIRGTEWAIQADEASSQLQVFSGSVELSNEAGSLVVEAGQAASVLRGQAPTRTVLTNPVGREQMLYFVDVADGLDLIDNGNPTFAKAREQVAVGEWQQATDLFERLVNTRDPKDRAAGIYGRYIAAVQLGEDVAAPELSGTAEGYLAQILIAAFDGDLVKAGNIATKAVSRFPETAALYQAKARVEALVGQPDQAITTINTARRRFPEDARLQIAESDLLRDYGGSPKAARNLAQPIAKADPENIAAQKSLAKSWMAIGEFNEAHKLIENARQKRPRDDELLSMAAQVALARNQLDPAKQLVDQALELNPSNPLAAKTLADYWARKDDLDKALEQSLAASAQNPDFGLGFLGLAQIQYDMGERGVAEQQFDAADRLDPNNPAIPLARTAVALHSFDGDAAIVNAREALKRYRARGGEYFNLSENRETGSLVSQAFRFLDLEGWGRYYADRVFDSFTPSSYFDQALNQTPGPFLIRNFDGSFNAQQSQDLDTTSSFLQGLALDPLGVASSDRRLRFDNGNFFEAGIGGFYFSEDLRNIRQLVGGVDAIVDSPLPIALNIDARYIDTNDSRGRPDLDFFTRQRGGDDWQITGYLGAELTPSDNIVLNIDLSDRARLSDTNELGLINGSTELRERVDSENQSLFALWSHEFGYRNLLTIAGAIGNQDQNRILQTVSSTAPLPDSFLESDSSFRYVSANYARGFGPVDLRIGAEYSDIRLDELRGNFNFDDPAAGRVVNGNPFRVSVEEFRAYADIRYQASEVLVFQGQLEFVSGESVATQIGAANVPNPDSFDRLNWRLGGSFEPVEGQWLRAAHVRENNSLFDFSFRPVAVVGLKPNTAPNFRLSRSDSTIVRWDAEWSSRFFTSVEYQAQDHEAVRYFIPDLPVDIFGNPVSLDRVSLQANYWLGHNIGLRASYAYTDSDIAGTFISGANASQALGGGFGCSTADGPFANFCLFEQGDQLPFVPGHFARGSIVWSLPAPIRLRAELSGSYIGNQTDDLGDPTNNVALFDLRLKWEPRDRHVIVDLALLNLFDKQYESATGVKAPRFTILAGLGIRF